MDAEDQKRFESLLRYYQERVLRAPATGQGVAHAVADLVSFLLERIHKLEGRIDGEAEEW